MLVWLIFTLLLSVSLEEREVRLAFLGDVMLGRGVAQAHSAPDGTGWEKALEGADPLLSAADLRLANLESPLASNPPLAVARAGPAYILCSGVDGLAALTAARLDILSLANNHTDDCQAGGTAQTQAILAGEGLLGLAPGSEPVYRRVDGLLLAFMAVEDVSTALDVDATLDQIRAARGRGAQVIVSIHWGSEYQAGPNSRQAALAQALANAGASVIWGHHPHVLQKVIWLQGQGQSSPALVIYSLGNALFDQVVPPDARRSAALLVTLDSSGARGVEALPLEIDPIHGETHPASQAATKIILDRLGEQLSPNQ